MKKVPAALVLGIVVLLAGQALAVPVRDSFDRPDGPIGAAWTEYNGTWVVRNQAAAVTNAGHIAEATRDIGVSNNYKVEADLALSPTPLRANAGLVANYVGHNDQLYCKVEITAEHKGGFMSIGHILGGVANSLLAYQTKVGVQNGGTYHMTFTRSRRRVRCTVSGGGLAASSSVTYTLPRAEARSLRNGTSAGLRARWDPDEDDGLSTWDNFSATALT